MYDINKLSLEEKVGQMIIVGLDSDNAVMHLEEIINKYKVGVDMDLAPVLDIKRFKDNQAIGDRAYSENIEEVL